MTGDASGIGEAAVRLFVEEGAWVAFVDRDGARGVRVAEGIKASGGEVLFVEAHVEREAEAMGFIRFAPPSRPPASASGRRLLAALAAVPAPSGGRPSGP